MEPEPDPACACARKRPYATRPEARAAIKQKKARPDYKPRKGEYLHPYLCAVCGQWHVGNAAYKYDVREKLK